MGSSLCMRWFAIPQDKDPKWSAAMKEAKTKAEKSDLDEIVACWTQRRREADVIWAGNHRILITGGPTWGDPPTTEYELFGRVRPEVMEAAGFTAGTNAFTISVGPLEGSENGA